MNSSWRLPAALGAVLVAFSLSWAGLNAQTIDPSQPPPDQTANQTAPADADQGQPGVTVEARGPIHEAYAEPTDANPQPGPVVAKQPPDPVPEQPPDQKPESDSVVWIPGYWAWDVDRQDFLWVSGFWRIPPPGRRWVPGHWSQVEGGWQWSPGLWAAADQDDVHYLAAPPESLDNGPDVPAPDDDSIYVPGCWVPQNDQFAWRPGYWQAAQPGWVWTNACYTWSPSGYIYNPGYWDYSLEDRGLLFAPVSFAGPLWTNPGWFYRPWCTVNVGGALSSLFCRPGFGHYYFGDYYSQRCWGLGFRPWYSYGARYHDPLFGYYRWVNRGNPGWYAGLRNTYWGRRDGTLARPPHTLVDQRNFFRQINVAVNRNTINNVTNIRGNRGNVSVVNNNALRMVTPLSQYRGNFHLGRVGPRDLAAHQASAQHFQSLSQQRARAERLTALGADRASVASRANLRGTTWRLPPDQFAGRSAGAVVARRPRGAPAQGRVGALRNREIYASPRQGLAGSRAYSSVQSFPGRRFPSGQPNRAAVGASRQAVTRHAQPAYRPPVRPPQASRPNYANRMNPAVRQPAPARSLSSNRGAFGAARAPTQATPAAWHTPPSGKIGQFRAPRPALPHASRPSAPAVRPHAAPRPPSANHHR
jgi:hypothetical protein